jgi:putative transposase
VRHSNNGPPTKSATLLSKMYELGVMPSRSRPFVSNDNPYPELLLRTVKYCLQWPVDGFGSLESVRVGVVNLPTGTAMNIGIVEFDS